MSLRSKTHSNNLSLQQQERLTLLINTLCSAATTASEILINGYTSGKKDQKKFLQDDISMLNYLIGRMIQQGDLDQGSIVSQTLLVEDILLGEGKLHYQPHLTDEI